MPSGTEILPAFNTADSAMTTAMDELQAAEEADAQGMAEAGDAAYERARLITLTGLAAGLQTNLLALNATIEGGPGR